MIKNLIKDANKLFSSNPESRRLEYCLKQALRLANARLEEVEIFHLKNSFDENHNLTTIETIEHVSQSRINHYESLTGRSGKLNISKKKPKKFTYGTIIEDADEISSESDLVFCVYKVAVGRSFCYKLQPGEVPETIPLKQGYDSMYLDSP